MTPLLRIAIAVCATASLATIAFTVLVAEGLGGALFGVWAALPYGAIAAAAFGLRSSKVATAILLLAALAMAAFAGVAYYDAFFVALDPQSALVLVLVPVAQLVAAAVASALAAIAWLIARKRTA